MVVSVTAKGVRAKGTAATVRVLPDTVAHTTGAERTTPWETFRNTPVVVGRTGRERKQAVTLKLLVVSLGMTTSPTFATRLTTKAHAASSKRGVVLSLVGTTARISRGLSGAVV